MPPNEDPKSEQLSQAINAEIERKVSERLRELEERLDQRAQASIRDDRAFVKDTIGVAFKVAGFAVAVVVVLLGAFGWKTFSDVNRDVSRRITDAAEAKTQAYLESKEGQDAIHSTLDRTVLDLYRARTALLMSADNTRREPLTISSDHANRLLGIIKNERMDPFSIETAANTLVLAFSSVYSQGSPILADIGEAFAAFISSKGKDEKWREKNYRKRLAILKPLSESEMSESQIKNACRELISGNEANELKGPAVTYLGTVKDRDALGMLVELAKNGKELGDEAVVAVAKIEPGNEVVKKWTAALNTIINPPVEMIITALKISEALQPEPSRPQFGGFASAPPAEAADQDTVLKLLKFAAQNSQLFIDTRRPDRIFVTCLSNRCKSIEYRSAFLFDHDAWTNIVSALLRSSAQKPDLEDFRSFIRWLTVKDSRLARISPVRVRLRFLGHSAIASETGGEPVDKQSAPDGVILVPEEEIKDGKRSEQVKWTDPERGNSGILARFDYPEDLRFKPEVSF